MAIWPTTPTAIRARIASYRRILRQEFKPGTYGGDGYGKRYWLFMLYFLLREDDEVRSYIDWYTDKFPDDIGHVGQFVCWALILRRLGREDEAVYRFVLAIDENLPAVAKIVGDYQGPFGIAGEEMLFIHDLDGQILAAMAGDERAWLHRTWHSPPVAALRERLLTNARVYAAATTQAQREALSLADHALVESFRPAVMPPLSAGPASAWLAPRRSTPRSRLGTVIRTTPDVWRR